MKKTLSLSCAFFFAAVLSAQITITGSDLPQAGQTYLAATDTTPAISLGSPGPSAQNWNFTSLSQDYPSVPTYGATQWTPYAGIFTASNLYTYGPAALYSSFYGGAPVGSQGMNKGYMFWESGSSGFRIVGFRADSGAYSNVNVLENPKELLIGTPATYGTVFNNTARWEFPMNINSADMDTYYVNLVTKTLTADAWGSITTPGGSFPNVLRIHEYLVKVDSVYAKIGSSLLYSLELTRDTLNNYIYMANGIHYPVSIVHADKNNAVKNVEYYLLTYQGVNELSSVPVKTIVYPDPVTHSALISIPPGYAVKDAVLCLFDAAGNIIRKETLSPRTVEIDADTFCPGIYFFTVLNCRGEALQGKFSVIK